MSIETVGLTSGNRELAALLFMAASTNAMDAYSALNSSPWTAESFGGNPEKAKACHEYVCHAVAITTAWGIASSVIAKNPWPIIGTVLMDGYMYWLYRRALTRAVEKGSQGWDG